jgi:flap endonuclease-1
MSIYQFLIAVRSEGQQLMNESGETTSHIMGMFYRTLRMIDNGIKYSPLCLSPSVTSSLIGCVFYSTRPLYVFDGKPPTLKSGELAKRVARKTQAEAEHVEAKETGTAEEIEKFARRTVRVTREQNDDCKKLLKVDGNPVCGGAV